MEKFIMCFDRLATESAFQRAMQQAGLHLISAELAAFFWKSYITGNLMTGSGPQARITACLAPSETETQSLGSMELSRELAVPFSNSTSLISPLALGRFFKALDITGTQYD